MGVRTPAAGFHPDGIHRYAPVMHLLGLLLALFGIATIALHLLEVHVEFLSWIGNWGTEAAWGIRIGAIVLGLLLMKAGGGSGKKQSR